MPVDRPELTRLLREAVEAYKAMTPEQREAMHAAQRASFIRAEKGYRND